jgi:shikimate dehydrogenase
VTTVSPLGPRTRLLGVIGWPVAHSLSPAMQGAGLRALGLDWAYAAFAVPPENLAAAVRGAGALGMVGLNVTLPHKEAVVALCRPDALSAQVGAVNTLCFDPDRGAPPRGYNTDVQGFRGLCQEAGVPAAPGLRALLLGTGGAARAAVVALRQQGAHVRAAARAPRPFVVAGEAVPVLPLAEAEGALPGCDLLVDCTPRGLSDDAAGPDLAPLPDHAIVLDLVARPDTGLVRAARARGLRAEAGAAMLLHQGVAALTLFVGPEKKVSGEAVDAMRQALTAALQSVIIPA